MSIGSILIVGSACVLCIAIMQMLFEGTSEFVPDWPANQMPLLVMFARAFFAAAWPIALPIALVVAWPQVVQLIREHREKKDKQE